MMRSELGSIRERKKGVWEVRVSLGYDSSGKYRTKSKTIRGTKKDARIALNSLLAEYGHGANEDITLQAFCHDVYMPWHRKEYPRKDSTHKLEYTIKRICDEMPVKPLNSLSKAFLVQWCGTHPQWMQNRLRAVLNKAVEWEYLERNPMKGIGDKQKSPERKRITPEQLVDVLEAVRGTAIEAGIILQASCGLRKAEALAIDWSDIDFESGLLEVRRTWHYDKGGGWFEDTKNQNSKGKVRIPSRALERLKAIRTQGAIIRQGAICVMNGQRMIPNTYTKIWNRLVRPVLGDDYIPCENLRHTHGSMLFDAGVPVQFISKRLRHSSTRITERYYIREDSTADDTAADAFDSIFTA